MKKTMISILLACLTLSMTACSSTEESSGSSVESQSKTDEVLMESGNFGSMAEEPTESRNEAVSAQYVIGDIILAYELDEEAAMNGLETNWYWSSSQAGAEDDYAWFVHYFNGYAGECPKNFTNVHALAVRVF